MSPFRCEIRKSHSCKARRRRRKFCGFKRFHVIDLCIIVLFQSRCHCASHSSIEYCSQVPASAAPYRYKHLPVLPRRPPIAAACINHHLRLLRSTSTLLCSHDVTPLVPAQCAQRLPACHARRPAHRASSERAAPRRVVPPGLSESRRYATPCHQAAAPLAASSTPPSPARAAVGLDGSTAARTLRRTQPLGFPHCLEERRDARPVR